MSKLNPYLSEFHSGFLKSSSVWFALLMRVLDVFSVLFAGVIAYYARFDSLSLDAVYQFILVGAAFGVMLIFSFYNLYRPWRGFGIWSEISLMGLAWLSVIAVTLGVIYFTKSGESFSRVWFGVWAMVSYVILILIRMILRNGLKWIRSKGYNMQRVLIVGSGDLGNRALHHIQQNDWTGLRVIGFLDDSQSSSREFSSEIPYLGKTDRLYELTVGRHQDSNMTEGAIDLTDVDQVWITLPINKGSEIDHICKILENTAISIVFVPDIFTLSLFSHSVDNLAGMPIVNLRSTPIYGSSLVLKTIEDLLFSAVILVLTSPLLIIISIIVKLESKGPVIFKQRRYGIDGKEILIWKFRTMTVMEDGGSVPQALRNDPRITRVGFF
ncbi:MAG: hypothetical protein GKR95_24855 [Gammaproteobacteria bacterium]|nr:hypothetical protein [Gammaproteobacteria bacterium]